MDNSTGSRLSLADASKIDDERSWCGGKTPAGNRAGGEKKGTPNFRGSPTLHA